ncbi:MAG: MBL fold metallo-hydrolase [Saprospiraceae bacterium]
MSQVVSLTYSPFAENTYLVFDDTRECLIIDPGCYTREEEKHLAHTIDLHQLKPVRLLNTHGHIDHVFGNRFVLDTWGLEAEIHEGELPVLNAVGMIAQMYGIPMRQEVPPPGRYLQDGEEIHFGKTILKSILAPGHSPAHLCFYCEADRYLIGGDVLFQGSIGRTDLPGGNHDQLLDSILKRIYTLPDETTVYSGHGPETTIGWEAKTNPFVQRSGHTTLR